MRSRPVAAFASSQSWMRSPASVLALETDTSLCSRRTTRVLEQIIEARGTPQSLICDNGPELTSRHFLSWCEERKIELIHIQPGKPMQNGHVESFNGRLGMHASTPAGSATWLMPGKKSVLGAMNTTTVHTAPPRYVLEKSNPCWFSAVLWSFDLRCQC
jgi:transposase InsO family protein